MSLDIEDFTLDMIITQAKAAQLKKEANAEKLPALFDKTLDALVTACEKLEAITAERDQLMSQVEALKQGVYHFNRSHGDLNPLFKAVTESPKQCLADIRAKAVMNFAEVNRGAYLSGFVTAELTVYDVYQSARNHVKDNYGYETSPWDGVDSTIARNALNELRAKTSRNGFIAGVLLVNPTAKGRESLNEEANKYADSIRQADKGGA